MPLTLATYQSLEGSPYCRAHYAQLRKAHQLEGLGVPSWAPGGAKVEKPIRM